VWERLNSLDQEKQKRIFGVEITSRRGGVIVIVGPMAERAALLGLLVRVRDLGQHADHGATRGDGRTFRGSLPRVRKR
jgi:hypothetical protein